MTVRRRAVIRSVAAASASALAGCLGGSEPRVRVLNDTGATATVTTVIREVDTGTAVLVETFDLPPAPDDDVDEGSRVFDEAVEAGTTYEVRVTVVGGPSATGEYDSELGRFWATVERDGIDFQTVAD